jgi:hypothetical protein
MAWPRFLLARRSVIHVRDEKASGTHGGGFTAGAWQKRTLNTVVRNELGGASLAGDEVTLLAGRYECRASAPARIVNGHKARLWNVTAGATLIMGTSEYAIAANFVQSRSFIEGEFTLAATSVVRLEHRCETTGATTGFGYATTIAGEIEVYSVLWIRRVG